MSMNLNEDSLIEPLQMQMEDEEDQEADFKMEEQDFDCNLFNSSSQKIIANSNLDLEIYGFYYRGNSKIQRLLYVADHCKDLELPAIKIILNYILSSASLDTSLYIAVHERIKKFYHDIQDERTEIDLYKNMEIATFDREWVEMTAKKSALKLDKLDNDLKNYKNNFIKDSIRRGYYDLGEYYLLAGDLNNALKCFSRPRDYCVTPKHMISTCLNVMRVSIYLANWNHVINCSIRAESIITNELTALTGKDSMKDVTQGSKLPMFVNRRKIGPTTSASNPTTATTSANHELAGANASARTSDQILEDDGEDNEKPEASPSLSLARMQSQNLFTVSLSKVNWMAGLAEMCQGNFKNSARRFLLVSSVDHVTLPNQSTVSSSPANITLDGTFQSPGTSSHLTSQDSCLQQSQPLIIRPIHRKHAKSPTFLTNNEKETQSNFSKTANQSTTVAAFEDSNANYVISPNNLAWYAGLTALATFDREELQKMVLNGNCAFKQFIELEPNLREILYAFHSSKFQECLTYLEDVKDQLILDLYLGPILEKLYKLIRIRAIIEYVMPYSRIDLKLMLSIFYANEPSNPQSANEPDQQLMMMQLEQELFLLIDKGSINGKIDSINKVLHTRTTNERQKLYESVTSNETKLIANAKNIFIRAAVLESGIVIKSF